MATRYFVGQSGNWSDTRHWSTSSGGAGGASYPVAGDIAIFDDNSSATPGTISPNIDVDVNVDRIDCSGVVTKFMYGVGSTSGKSITANYIHTGTSAGAWDMTGVTSLTCVTLVCPAGWFGGGTPIVVSGTATFGNTVYFAPFGTCSFGSLTVGEFSVIAPTFATVTVTGAFVFGNSSQLIPAGTLTISAATMSFGTNLVIAPATAVNLSCPANVTVIGANIQNCNASGGGNFVCLNGNDLGGNTGWVFVNYHTSVPTRTGTPTRTSVPTHTGIPTRTVNPPVS